MIRRNDLLPILLTFILLAIPILASSGDRNPTFQHCLKGCQLTYCEPHQPPIPKYLRMFGWTCKENCAYECGHTFTDNIRPGSKNHQFYGKWAFYRLGPFQEPFSILMSIGNFYVNFKGLEQLRRRVRKENGLRNWLVALAFVQMNTWIWSSVFHARDTPNTERMDYFSATLTISFTLLYSIIRIFHLQTPISSSKYLFPVSAIIGFIVLGHFTYLLSFPKGQFPYGYHTKFNLLLAAIHNLLWISWSLSFQFPFPKMTFLGKTYTYPKPYPPNDPKTTEPKPSEYNTPLILVLLTTLAMSFELFDFAPVGRVIDAHSLWHFFTIPLTIAWWHFMVTDAIELEGSLLSTRGGHGAYTAVSDDKSEGNEGGRGESDPPVPRTPNFAQLAAGPRLGNLYSPGKSPKLEKPE
ncbi:uncharacterized protein I206_102220 [Kwoniella pini CBS 10737]|uniref:Post-GPI attachment to proteins factor 3 n=1 Tax=Kwoniella pini CBS 10737 TaxID=1296096 RepID=A0A1B9HSW8_9TREE|nr:uncharacterized protein I206_07588 [Kwoniella pini CBS 10737]OCF46355.1 hypothetical protein I206_07588 [Kwoniella pini CBS 10737]